METEVPLPLEPAAPPAPAPTPDPAPSTPEPREPAPDQSVTDHEAANPIKAKHRRARSHEATAEDVPRIASLTKKLRETEAALAAARNGRQPAEAAPVIPAPAQPVTSAPAAVASPTPAAPTRTPAPTPVAAAEEDPEPDPADYLNDPSKNYVKDQARWEARQAIREENELVASRQAFTRERDYWMMRADDVKKVHADFEAVAYGPSPIPKGSMVDRFIRESAAGLHVLYHLHKHRNELNEMLALPLFDPATNRYPQVEALSQLALRLAPNGHGRPSAVTTGSVAPPTPVKPTPRPPNPVRTGPLSSANEPPGANASVSEHEAFFNKRRR